jgi:hypothetical protein
MICSFISLAIDAVRDRFCLRGRSRLVGGSAGTDHVLQLPVVGGGAGNIPPVARWQQYTFEMKDHGHEISR